jgi:CrcB protein
MGLKDLLLLAMAGGLGALARYGLSGAVYQTCGEKFAWGTLAVNALGCFLFALIWTMAEDRIVISGHTRMIILTGFMGAFTTFSTYAFETSRYINDSQWNLVAANVLAQNVLGLACVFAGLAAGRLMLGGS